MRGRVNQPRLGAISYQAANLTARNFGSDRKANGLSRIKQGRESGGGGEEEILNSFKRGPLQQPGIAQKLAVSMEELLCDCFL